MESKCATQHITLSLHGDDPPVAAAAAAVQSDVATAVTTAPHQQQQQTSDSQLHCHMVIECMVVSVWDDERRRLLGGGGGQGATPAELCCVYWDQLSVHLTRGRSTGLFVLQHTCCDPLSCLGDMAFHSGLQT